MIASIETTRLRLSPLLPHHADALYVGLQDPSIYRYIDERAPVSREALRDRYERLATRRSPDGHDVWLNWVVWSHEAGAWIGTVQATLPPGDVAEIAYVILPPWWGRGLAREAVEAMIIAMRAHHDITTLIARVHPDNRRSVALLTRLGFARVAPERADGAPRDEVYSLRS